jgi:MinD superfamily P-loop ATPase
MSVQIIERCVMCGACEWECPAEAITPSPRGPVVEPERCTECYGHFGESQCIVVCPVDAIQVVPERVDDLSAKYARQHPNREPQDVRVWRRITGPSGAHPHAERVQLKVQ